MVHFPGLPQAALFLPNLLSIFLGLIFGWEKVRIWTSILQGNYSSMLQIDVRFLNHPKLDLYNLSYGPFSGTTIGYPVLIEPTV